MIREVLNKLNEKQMNYCKTMSVVIAIDKVNLLKLQYERDCGKLRGFLDCLMQMNVITINEMKALYLWFITGNRNEGDNNDKRRI